MFNKIRDFLQKHNRLTFIAAFLILVSSSFHLFDVITRTYISADFVNLRPTRQKLYVYFKGYQIGRVLKIEPVSDYTSSSVKMVLYPRDLFLPSNTTAVLKKENHGDKEFNFIELVYPDAPSIKRLRTGMTIEGKASVDIQSYLDNQDPETLNKIRDNMTDLSSNINTTVNALGDLFVTLQDMVNENRPNVLQASKNLADTSGNLKDVARKLNEAMTQQRLNNTVANIDLTSENVKKATSDVQIIIGSLDDTTSTLNSTMPKVDSTMSQVQHIVSNVDVITTGIKETLQKRFGTMRLLLGTPVENSRKQICPSLQNACEGSLTPGKSKGRQE